ncbi:PEBP-like protein [Coprinopsis marcescibilis]|uniref:PEBP-like protein n=1 Tax=Coprinopsis marcescibilis TaxID=230819 RepID=A0A5C3L045_COPMA|nr:PEBP-like protein [Coprinopsis marcescibilis]
MADVQPGGPIPDPSTTLLAILTDGGIIPDVIPASLNFKPSVYFSTIFPGFASSKTDITLGTTYERSRTLKEPDIEVVATAPEQLEGAVPGSTKSYTLVMTDPDAPSRSDPKFGQWRHWVTTGVKLPEAASGNSFVTKSKPASTPYEGPSPPPGSGPHRYVFLLFEEPPSFSLPEDAVESSGSEKTRPKWNAMKFAEKYNLKLVRVNFFFTHQD